MMTKLCGNGERDIPCACAVSITADVCRCKCVYVHVQKMTQRRRAELESFSPGVKVTDNSSYVRTCARTCNSS